MTIYSNRLARELSFASRTSNFLSKFRTIVAGLAVSAAAVVAIASPASAETKVVTIQQVSNNRFVDAHEHAGEDYRIVTRTAQNNATQRWRMTNVGGNVYTIQQMSNGRYWDAHEHSGEDYRLVTRPAQNNDTQRWLVLSLGGGIYTIQQVSNGRYVDAHEHAGEDYRLVTRTAQNNATQQWRISTIYVEPEAPPPPPPVPPVLSSGSLEVPPTFSADFDAGTLSFAGADITYNPGQLQPINGARINFAGGAQRGFVGCSAAAFTTNPVPVASLSNGDYVCVRTSNNRISEFRVNQIGPLFQVLSLGYTTWQ